MKPASASFHSQSFLPAGQLEWSLSAILIAAGLLGGGGVAYGFFNLAVQLVALVALAFNREAFFVFWRDAPAMVRALVLATLALPAIQLIPLPPSLWQALPGRELAIEARELANAPGWYPASLDRGRTLVALTSLIVPLAIVSLGWNAQKSSLIKLAWLIVALGLANFAIGVPQVLSQGQSAMLYPENPMPGVLFGFFANRNTAGIFLATGLAVLASLPLDLKAKPRLVAQLMIFALLFFAILLTRSRTGIVLALIPAVAITIRILAANLASGMSRRTLIAGFAVSLALGAGLFASIPGSRLETSLDRFAQREDPRSFIWEDALYSADRFWPVGSGVGTFDDVFQIDQSLENMGRKTAGRAHNDYLELAIETGAFGFAILAVWLAYLFWRAAIARRSRQRWIAWGGVMALALIAGQSITDYPLRNLTMLAIAAFMLLVLIRFGEPNRELER